MGNTLETPRHNLGFGGKIRKIGIPMHTPVLLYKSGVLGVYVSWKCYPGVSWTTILADQLMASTAPYILEGPIFDELLARM